MILIISKRSSSWILFLATIIYKVEIEVEMNMKVIGNYISKFKNKFLMCTNYTNDEISINSIDS